MRSVSIRRRLAAAIMALGFSLLAACAGLEPEGEREAAVPGGIHARSSDPGLGDDPVLAAFWRTLETYYEERRLREQEGYREPKAPFALLKRRALEGARLIEALGRAGLNVSVERARKGLSGIAGLVERYVHTRTPLAFARVERPAAAPRDPANAFPGSFLVAAGVERRAGLRARWAGREARWDEVIYDETLIEPYEHWLAVREQREPEALTFVVGTVIYVDRGRTAERIRARFVERRDELRALAERFRRPGDLRELERAERLEALRDLLRWRALGPLVAGFDAAQATRVLAEIEARRAARIAAAWLAFSDASNPLVREARALVALLAEPGALDVLATIVGLYAGPRPALGLIALKPVLAAWRPDLRFDEALAALAFIEERELRAVVEALERRGRFLAPS